MTYFESIRRGGDDVMRPPNRVFSYNKSVRNTAAPRVDTLEIRNVTTYAVNNRKLLNGLNLDVKPGQNICIVSTKKDEATSLLGLLSCLQNPSKGSIKIGELEITQNSHINVRKHTYLLLEDPWVFNGSIQDNITFGSGRVPLKLLQQAIEITGLDKLIANLPSGMQTKLSDIPDLSIFQRRQIHIARAWLRNPKILFMVEPTSELAEQQEKVMTKAIERLRQGRTMITFSHQLKVARNADNVLILDKGKLLPYSGQNNVWLKQPSSTSLWERKKAGEKSKGLMLLKANQLSKSTSSASSQIVKIERKQEVVANFTATGLLARNESIDTWIAWSSKHVCPVRIKVPRFYPVDEKVQKALLQEYEPLKNFTHPSIAVPYAAELGVDLPYTMYEYLESPSLSSTLRRSQQGIKLVDVLLMAYDLAGALSEIHKGGYVHLNITARQIRKRDDTWVMTDFSHLIKQGELITNTGQEPSIQPPEFEKHKPSTYAMDVYQLGRLMHAVATGKQTPGENDFTQHMIDQSLPGAPQAMRNILRSMLMKDPNKRPSMERVEWELKRLMPLKMRNERALQAHRSLNAV